VLNHQDVRERARVLFGPDWSAANEGRSVGVRAAAPEFFSKSFPPRLLRIGESEYVAVLGCLVTACSSRRGLLLIRRDSEQLFARLDEGGFTHYYALEVGMGAPPETHALVDAAWRVLEQASGWEAG
jgi:hypothetical protein